MTKSAQSIIDEVESIKYPQKQEKKDILFDKSILKELIFEERSKKPSLTPFEISNKYFISKDEAKSYLDEFLKKTIEKSKKVEKINKKVKKIHKIPKINLFDNEDVETIKNILLKIVIFGVPINFFMFVIFKIKFTWYSWIAWGYLLWFIKKELINILRSLWIK